MGIDQLFSRHILWHYVNQRDSETLMLGCYISFHQQVMTHLLGERTYALTKLIALMAWIMNNNGINLKQVL